jgi:hypothetical protein
MKDIIRRIVLSVVHIPRCHLCAHYKPDEMKCKLFGDPVDARIDPDQCSIDGHYFKAQVFLLK